ncbi:MAG: lysoplasmalogenase [Bacteroidia bacterium]|nr:lysoplasmalogenase [Bacteroidia bacterium]
MEKLVQKNFRYIFLLLTIGYCLVEVNNLSSFRYALKPLLLLSLSYYFYLSTRGVRSKFSRYMQIGLIFSLLGDILLMFTSQSELYFIFGLVAFLLAHVCYCLAFIESFRKNQFSLLEMLLAAMPFLLMSGTVFYILMPYLKSMLVPVLAYILVITAMGIFSALRYKSVERSSYYSILAGALFFMLSDTLLAFNKFYQSYSYAGIAIMSTYILAQYLLVEGSLSTIQKKDGIRA